MLAGSTRRSAVVGESPTVLVVGELNPYGADPRMALFHLPRRASGDRLRQILGLSDVDYSRLLAKLNLCAGRWSTPAARRRARLVLETGAAPRVLVLLGQRVRDAFGAPDFYRVGVVGEKLVATLPHPSGLCRLWNDPGAVGRARSACEAVAPWVPWGRHGSDSPVIFEP